MTQFRVNIVSSATALTALTKRGQRKSMISRKEIIIPSPRAPRNTSNGVVVLIGVKKREGEGGGSLEKLRERKERPCPKRSDEIG